MKNDYRHTKVIFTIGPATESEEVLEQLITNGADICRLNMAHANREWVETTVARINKVCKKVGRQIAIMMDVKGPEIRTGDLPEPIELQIGDIFDFKTIPDSTEHDDPNIRSVGVNYPKLNENLKPGDVILVDSGLIRLTCTEVFNDRVRAEVRIPGPLGNRRHINLPGVHVDLPCLTKKDKNDVLLGIEVGVSFFALSFVRSADDLDILRRYLNDHDSQAQIIAKIEDQSAITHIDEIIQACNGLMVARGDLGIECPYEQLPMIQRRAIHQCIAQQKFVIVATHMLESMIQSPIPTRAEVTDIANAVHEQTDCIMLSGETTVGKYPVESLMVMNRICREIEHHKEASYNKDLILRDPKSKLLGSAVQLAQDLNKASILIFTRNGRLARTLAALRPTKCPIFAFTDHEETFKQLLPLWGIEPFFMDFKHISEETNLRAMKILVDKGWLEPNEWMVIISNVIHGKRVIDSVQMRRAEYVET